MQGLPDWITLGGHGLYVWGSYAVTLVAMLVDAWSARRAVQEQRDRLEEDLT